MFGSIGSTELLLILVVALLVLGPKSLANMARSVGKVVGEFRRVSTDFQRTLNAEVALEEEKEKRDKAAKEVAADLQQPAASTAATPESRPEGQTGELATGPATGQETARTTTPDATTAANPASDGDAEDDMLSPPPGSTLDEALKKAAAEAGATELMEPVTVEATQPARTPESQAQPAAQHRA